MTDEPKLEFTTDAFGHVTCSITHEGVLLTKVQAESVAERIKALEELVQDMHHYCDTLCTECEFVNGICDGEGASECLLFIRIEQRMDELGIQRGQ